MQIDAMELRWIAPPGIDAHPRFALVRHSERLFSYSELLLRTPVEQIVASLDAGVSTPQQWWDELVSRSPDTARVTASLCRPLDFEVLDLYAVRPAGTA